MSSKSSFLFGLTIGLIAGIFIGIILSTFIIIQLQQARMDYIEKGQKENQLKVDALLEDKEYIDKLHFLLKQAMKEANYMEKFNEGAVGK